MTIAAALSVSLFYLGTINILMSRFAGTCQVLERMPYPQDGNELFYGIAWPTVSLATLIILIALACY
ncbi:MAG: hypothetical protein P8Q92_02160 [Pseudoprimorskyibacter sp.]|nr:hypothetical protein [Pseudoprimorskyibacter sp.]